MDPFDFNLEQLDPRATLVVLTNATTYEGGFVRGEVLRSRWEHKDLAQVGSRMPIRDGWLRCHVPYPGRCLVVKFLSPEFQLLDENSSELGKNQTGGIMPKNVRKPKKGGAEVASAKPAAQPEPAAKPAAAKKPAIAPKAPKVVDVTKKPAAATKAPEGEPTGYPWGMNRLKNEIVKFLTPDENQAQVRKDLKELKRFEDVRKYANAAGIDDDALLTFLDGFFARCANH